MLPPGDMSARIAAACVQRGQDPPRGPVALVRCVVDSLALAHAQALADSVRLSGRRVRVLHVIGGGTRNDLLCGATALRTGTAIAAGPVEATVIGNALVRAGALGAVPGDLEPLRDLVRRTRPVRWYRPHGRQQGNP